MSQTISNGRPPQPGTAPAVALHIDWTRCDGRGLCSEILPELLERDEWGYPLAAARHRGRDIPIPAESEAAARDAVALCPVIALRLTDPHAR
ncbi:ferredoxin [Gryllotalpicola koreensis]|uniref:ferredoxin n=1 Tax=Gryllotalpicola koreensis TaxID=993086 RepID=UPI0031E33AF5